MFLLHIKLPLVELLSDNLTTSVTLEDMRFFKVGIYNNNSSKFKNLNCAEFRYWQMCIAILNIKHETNVSYLREIT